MAVSLDGQLVVAISSRALFDFEEENLVFEQSDDRAYMKLQLERLEELEYSPGLFADAGRCHSPQWMAYGTRIFLFGCFARVVVAVTMAHCSRSRSLQVEYSPTDRE